MAQIFTSNQVNHAYVVKSLSKDSSTPVKPTEASSKGATYVGVVKDSATGPVKSMYFMQRGAAGIVRSDMIDLDKIMYINYTPAADMARTPNTAAISFNSAALSGGAPIVGQDYVLRVEFQNPMGMSPDNKYFKFGVAHSVTGDTLKSVILKLAKSLAGNLKRDVTPLIKIYVATAATGTNKVEVTSTSNISDTTTYANNYTHIILEEVAQPWSLGVQQQKPVVFTIGDSPIKAGTPAVDIYWADVIYSDRKKRTGGAEPTMSVQDGTISSYVYIATAFNNSKLAAELEYFSMGERADRYRNVGWPDSIATEYLADSNAANGYDMISIHYAYTGSNHAVQKSEKDLTLIVARTGANDGTTYAATLGELAAEIKGIIEGIVNPEDSRYLTASKLFTDDSYTNGNNAIIAKASDGTVSIEDGGTIG